MNKCEAGHKKHDRILVDTELGKMWVYDWEKYKDQPGLYCTGQDDISRTLSNVGTWGQGETQMIRGLLQAGNRKNNVIDFGCHIGWYTILAGQLGYSVAAIDGNEENLKLLKLNAEIYGLENIDYNHIWVNEHSAMAKYEYIEHGNKDIELLKIDLEGNEQHAIRIMEHLLEQKKIKNIFMEVTPVFNDSYPALVQKIVDYGYNVFKDGKPFDFKYDFSQENLLFTLK